MAFVRYASGTQGSPKPGAKAKGKKKPMPKAKRKGSPMAASMGAQFMGQQGAC